MKKIAALLLLSVVSLGMFGFFTVAATAQNDGKPYEVTVTDDNKTQTTSLTSCTVSNGVESNVAESNCYYYYRYRRPVIYYRPVVHYHVAYYQPPVCYYYSYRYVYFYNGLDSNDSNGKSGFRMEKDPDEKSALGKQGVKAGDIITHINGKELKDTADIDNIKADSKLTVLKKSVNKTGSKIEDLNEHFKK